MQYEGVKTTISKQDGKNKMTLSSITRLLQLYYSVYSLAYWLKRSFSSWIDRFLVRFRSWKKYSERQQNGNLPEIFRPWKSAIPFSPLGCNQSRKVSPELKKKSTHLLRMCKSFDCVKLRNRLGRLRSSRWARNQLVSSMGVWQKATQPESPPWIWWSTLTKAHLTKIQVSRFSGHLCANRGSWWVRKAFS